MELPPIRDRDTAPELQVGLDVSVDFVKWFIFPFPFSSIQTSCHFCSNYPPWFGCLILYESVICNLSKLVRLYTSFPT